MFERFTERARKIMVLSQEEARNFNHNYIGTEHLLLGLIREEEGVAAQALDSLGVTLREAREQVEGIVGFGEEGIGSQAPFTPRSKKVLEMALREAMGLHHNYIGTEHLLLGLVRENEGVAARMLNNLDVDPDQVRREVVRRLSGSPGLDPLDSVEAQMEAEEIAARRAGVRGRRTRIDPEHRDLMIEAKVTALEVEVRYSPEQQPRKLLMDLEYEYDETGPSDEEASPSPETLASSLADHFSDQQPSSLTDVVSRAGRHIVERVPTAVKLVVTATDPEAGEDPPVSGMSVTGTFVV